MNLSRLFARGFRRLTARPAPRTVADGRRPAPDAISGSVSDEPTQYRIGGVAILLPPGHKLPSYQRTHKLYDRFLPVLAKELSSGQGVIVDVGANVGDTTVAVAQACDNRIVAIEGDSVFYDYLIENARRAGLSPDRVTLVRAVIGTGSVSGALVSDGSTAGLRESSTITRFESLDQTLASLPVAHQDVILLKVDADGYDWDVLASADQTLERSEPLLFWENELPEDDPMERYEALYRRLTLRGYDQVWVFDNFGNLMLSEASFDTLAELAKYVSTQDAGRSTRTIHYLDVLAATARRLPEARRSIATYVELIRGPGPRAS